MIEEEDDKLERNHCQTIKILSDGSKEVKDKKKFDTHDDAILFAKRIMLQPKIVDKLIGYKCTVCHQYHIGRNGKPLTDKYREKLKRQIKDIELLEKIEKVKNIKFKVVGKIDLSQFEKKKKKK